MNGLRTSRSAVGPGTERQATGCPPPDKLPCLLRIAHFGTFDVENYGDLLFPLVAQRRLAALDAELLCVSPVGGPPVWPDTVPTVAADALGDEPLDGVLFGGGNLVHAGPAGVDHYRGDGLTWLLAYARLWIDSARLAAERGIPLCWNAPGVPGGFGTRSAAALRTAVDAAAYVAVRDQQSLVALRGAGIDRAIEVVPDTALDIADLFSADELDESYAALLAAHGRQRPERAIAVHVNRRYLSGGAVEATAGHLDRIATATGSTPILLALGRCHDDDETARAIGARLTCDHIVVDRPAGLREIVAAISRADAYAGSSLHGMITALAFGRPAVVIAAEAGQGKFTGFLRQLHLVDRFLNDWAEAARRPELLRRTHDVEPVRAAARAPLDRHWARIAEALGAAPGERRTLDVAMDAVLEEAVHGVAALAARDGVRARDARRAAAALAEQVESARRDAQEEAATRQAAERAAEEESAARRAAERAAQEEATARQAAERRAEQGAAALGAQERLDVLREELAAARSRLAAADAARAAAEQDAHRTGLDLTAARDAATRSAADLAVARDTTRRLESELAAAGAEAQRLNAELTASREESAHAKDELRQALDATSAFEVERAETLRETARLEAQLAERDAAARAGQAELKGRLEEADTTARTVQTELHDARERARREAAAASTQASALSADVDRLAADLRAAKADGSAHAELSAARKQKIGKLETDLRAARAELDDCRRRIERARGQLVGFEASATRVAESRAWRLGHRVMRALRVVTLRRAKGAGAMPRLLAQAEGALQELTAEPPAAALPAPPAPPAPAPPGADGLAGLRTGATAIADLTPPRDTGAILRADVTTEPGSVDVVICVHNALPDVHRCLTSLLERSGRELRLILVDDGSDAETAGYLDAFAALNPAVDLHRNADPPHGYTIAANIGLRASTADFVVLLNSDTVLTRGWLDQLVAAGMADDSIGILGPLSNAASHQSVPQLARRRRLGGQRAARVADRGRPRPARGAPPRRAAAPRPLRQRILLRASGAGRSTRSGSSMRTASRPATPRRTTTAAVRRRPASSWRSSPGAYVLHAKSRSYGHEGRRALAKRHYQVFLERHGEQQVRQLVDELQANPSLAALRNRVGVALQRPEGLVAHLPRLRVTFVLPGFSKGGSGGTHSIYQEVAAMHALGLPARIAVAAAAWPRVTEAYADAGQLFVPYADQDELRALTAGDDVLVATHYTSAPLIAALVADRPGCLPAYYVQDYEPLFSAAGSESALAAERSYREIPGAVLFAKTAWLQQTLAERQRLPVARVEASIDHEVFHARGRRAPGDVVHVVAMVRPRTPRRAPAETIEVLGRLAKRHGAAIRVTTFGCEPAAFAKLGADAAIGHRGLLSRDAVADVLRDADVFLDCSWYQAFGRTGLEAMSCGATAVLPRIGGATEFARDGENCLLTDTWDVEATTAAVSRLVDDRALLVRLQDEAVATAAGYSAVRAALSEYALFCAEHRRRAGARVSGIVMD